MRVGALALLLLAALPLAARAQWLDSDTCWTCRDKLDHAIGGAAVGTVVRGPWIAAGWRDRWWKRLGVTMAVGCVAFESYQVYESRRRGWLGEPGGGFGLVDCVAVGAGWLASELVLTTLPRLLGGK